MKARLSAIAIALASAATALTPPLPAGAADYIRVYEDNGGICGHGSVLGAITRRFRHQVTHVPNLPDVDIVDFYGIYQKRYLPETESWPIARRYCGATVRLSDGRDRPIWYLIEYGQGFASLGDNVEFCVSGFDRWHVYDGNCRVLK